MLSNLQEEYDLHDGFLTGLGIVTIDAAKLSGAETCFGAHHAERRIITRVGCVMILMMQRTLRSGSERFRTTLLLEGAQQQVRIYGPSSNHSVT